MFELDSPSEVTEDLDYDIDAFAITLLANMTNRGDSDSDSYLHSRDCSSLATEGKYVWGKITPNMKCMMLKGRNSINRPNDRFNSSKTNHSNYKTIKLPSFNGNISLKLTYMNYQMSY